MFTGRLVKEFVSRRSFPASTNSIVERVFAKHPELQNLAMLWSGDDKAAMDFEQYIAFCVGIHLSVTHLTAKIGNELENR